MSQATLLGEASITEDELAQMAIAASPVENLEPGATPLPGSFNPDDADLPCWYMPVAANTSRSRWRTIVVIFLIMAFVFINALGYCITYGRLEIA